MNLRLQARFSSLVGECDVGWSERFAIAAVRVRADSSNSSPHERAVTSEGVDPVQRDSMTQAVSAGMYVSDDM